MPGAATTTPPTSASGRTTSSSAPTTTTRSPLLGDDGWLGLGTAGGAGLGRDPAEDDFGAIRFQADSGGGPDAAHTAYFDPGSPSLTNIGHVVTGAYGEITCDDPIHDAWWD